MPALRADDVASVRYTAQEVFYFVRGYNPDPVNNKARVVLTIDHEKGEFSVTNDTFLQNMIDADDKYRRPGMEKPLGFDLFRGSAVASEWEAIGRLIQEATRFGQDRLNDGRNQSPSKA